MATRAPKQPKGQPHTKVLQRYKQIRENMPDVFEKKQKRIDLRHTFLKSERTRNYQREYNNMLHQHLMAMAPALRRQDLHMRTRRTFEQFHGFRPGSSIAGK